MHKLKARWDKKMSSIYNWAIALAEKPNAIYALFAISFIESSFFPIPPDIILIPMIIATPKKAWKIAGVCTLGSVIGGYFGYAIGLFLFDTVAEPILSFYGYLEQFNHFSEYYNKWGAWIVAGGGLTPFPYKVITIASGVVSLNPVIFGIASILSRGLRFYAIALILWKFGEPMKIFIEKNLAWLSTAFFALLILGFAALKFI